MHIHTKNKRSHCSGYCAQINAHVYVHIYIHIHIYSPIYIDIILMPTLKCIHNIYYIYYIYLFVYISVSMHACMSLEGLFFSLTSPTRCRWHLLILIATKEESW